MNDVGDDQIAAGLARITANLRPASRWALMVAASALGTDGITGTLVIQIPRSAKDSVDVAFVAGICELTQRF